jgi:hypothetical protein
MVGNAEPVRSVEPVRPVVLDYATPSASRGFRAPIAVRLLLLAGAVAVFVPFTSSVSPFDTTVYLWKAVIVRRWAELDFVLGAAGLALEMALPMLLLTWVPQSWLRVSAAATIFCLATGLAGAGGAAYVATQGLYNSMVSDASPPRMEELLVFCLYTLAVAAGAVFTFRIWRRTRDLPQVAWCLLCMSYVPVAGLCLWVFRSGPELGYWLTLGNLVPVLFHAVNTHIGNTVANGTQTTDFDAPL